MTLNELKLHFKNSYDFERQIGMSHVNWSNWARRGYIPIESQMRIMKLSKGKFTADLNDIPGGK